MEMWIGDLLIDASPPEKPKFKSPMILVHGLWSGSWSWRTWATHFSNLGWECWAVNFRGRFEEKRHQILKQLDFQGCVEDMRKVVRSSSFPPVVVAHGLGGLVAQKLAEQEKISALILLSSVPPKQIQAAPSRSLRLLRLKYALLIFLRRPFRLEEKDFRRVWLASVPEGQRPGILNRMVPESGLLVREFFDRRVGVKRDRIDYPTLVVSGGEDKVMPISAQREMAQWLGGDLREYPKHGHWMLGEAEGEVIVRDIHRWVMQKLGENILLEELSR